MAGAGRPAWIDDELFPFESRCVAPDYPGFGHPYPRRGPILMPRKVPT